MSAPGLTSGAQKSSGLAVARAPRSETATLTCNEGGHPLWLHNLINECRNGDSHMKACTTEDGEIQALVVTRPVNDVLWIQSVYTRAEWRRKGLAARLLRSVISESDEPRVLSAMPAAAPGATACFRSLGFRHVLDIIAWPRWQTACAICFARIQGSCVDLLVEHPPESPHSRNMSEAATVCPSHAELKTVLQEVSPAPEGLRGFLPGLRNLVDVESDFVVSAISQGDVWLIPGAKTGDPHRPWAAVMGPVPSPHAGMTQYGIVAANGSGVEAALRVARVRYPAACRFYVLSPEPPLRLMGDQYDETQIWEWDRQ